MPTYKTITLDDEWLADEGLFESTQTKSPAGSLSIGLSEGKSFQTNPDFLTIAVFSRTEEGSGTTIGNIGRAGDGTLVSGTWTQMPDERYYFVNPTITYAHHPSMVTSVDSVKPTRSVAAAVAIRNPVSGTILEKQDYVRLSIDADKNLILERNFVDEGGVIPTGGATKKGGGGGGYTTITSIQKLTTVGGILDVSDEWMTVGFSINAGQASIVVNGKIMSQGRVDLRQNVDPGGPLTVGNNDAQNDPYVGDLDWIVYSGKPVAVSSFANMAAPTSGLWRSDVIDLGATHIFDRATHAGFANQDHSISLTMRLAATTNFRDPQIGRMSLTDHHIDYPTKNFYPSDHLEGRHLVAIVEMSKNTLSQFRPSLKTLQLRFREL